MEIKSSLQIQISQQLQSLVLYQLMVKQSRGHKMDKKFRKQVEQTLMNVHQMLLLIHVQHNLEQLATTQILVSVVIVILELMVPLNGHLSTLPVQQSPFKPLSIVQQLRKQL